MTTSLTETKDATEARRLEVTEVVPATDVYEREDAYLLVADLPGVDQKTLELSVEERVLAVDGLAEGPEPEHATLLHREFGPVRYHRTFQLCEDIDVEKISAVMKNGVLKLVLPKKPEARSGRKQIAVTAG